MNKDFDWIHTTGHFPRNAAKSQRLIPIAADNQCVASVAALRETKMSSSVDWIISNEILLEYEEKTADFYSPETAALVIVILSTASNVTFAEPFIKWALITDDPGRQ